ncbi:hypothetical protein Tco_1077904 [Tanacetum coccineum]
MPLEPTSSHEADYGFIDTLDAEVIATEMPRRQTQIYQRVDILAGDRQFHYETARLLDQEALGQLLAALGQIQALQARGQTHADDREGATSTAVGLVFSFLASDNHNNMPPRRSSATARAAAPIAPMTVAAVEQLIEARVSAALANHETLRNNTNGHGYIHLCECTYKDLLNCHPLNFKGTEGVVVLAQWFEKMESVFHISNCAVENQVKFTTCTFIGNALTWWNSHMKAVTQDVAYAMD